MVRRLVTCLVVFVLFTVTALAFAQGEETSVRTAFLNAAPKTLDPQTASEIDDLEAVSLLCEGLLTFDADQMSITPQLASGWSISEDGMAITFNLREDAVFSNGSPFTASDVKFSFQRLVELQATPTAEIIASIVGDVEVIDDYTALYTMSKSGEMQTLLFALAMPPMSILSNDLGSEYDFASDPTCIGSYRLVSYSSVGLEMERNPRYYGKTPAFDTIAFTGGLSAEDKFYTYLEGGFNLLYVDEAIQALIDQNPQVADQLYPVPSRSQFLEEMQGADYPETAQAIASSLYPPYSGVLVSPSIFDRMPKISPDDSWFWFCIFCPWC